VLPEAPAELVSELSRRYVYLYERITGQAFQVPDLNVTTHDRIMANLKAAGL
jgi:phosphoribosylaminoimidazole-succinocarboxamide synthase